MSKKITFVNFWFRQLCQYGGWVCCSNERVNTVFLRRSFLNVTVKKIMKIGPLLSKLWQKIKMGVFLNTVYDDDDDDDDDDKSLMMVDRCAVCVATWTVRWPMTGLRGAVSRRNTCRCSPCRTASASARRRLQHCRTTLDSLSTPALPPTPR